MVRLIGTFDAAAPIIKNIVATYWPILKRDSIASEFVGDFPSVMFRKGRSIGEHLVRSHYTPIKAEGNWLDRKVVGTYSIQVIKQLQSPHTGLTYAARDFFNCRTSGVVYMAMCDCPLIYVGKMIRELRRCILEHIGDIEHKRDTPVAKHMTKVHLGNPLSITFCVIEVIRSNGRREMSISYSYRKKQPGSIILRLLHPWSV